MPFTHRHAHDVARRGSWSRDKVYIYWERSCIHTPRVPDGEELVRVTLRMSKKADFGINGRMGVGGGATLNLSSMALDVRPWTGDCRSCNGVDKIKKRGGWMKN